MFPSIFSRLMQVGFASMLSFFLGAMTGAVSSYVTVRADASALSARVVVEEQRIGALEQSVAEWRAEDARTSAALAGQIKDAVDILTQLRIQLGPPGARR